MPLLLTGNKFHNDLKTNKCLAIFAPLEGGYETRLLRRMRAKGFKTFITSARGLGDPEVFLLKLHGIRPPHLCLLYTSPSPRDSCASRMPSSA